ncbi:MAG TPA: zinc ribbon domain-containing protein [Thermoleophilaceae bacterium]
MGLLAIFGIHNDTVNRVVSLLILFLVVIWLALIYWTYADAKRRIADPMLVGCATLCSVFPFLGTIIYMIVRPPEYLEDAREREIEIAAAEARLAELEQGCPYCGFRVEKAFLRCPSCLRRLKEPCQTCGKPLDPLWKICPYCESEIPGGAAPAVSEPARRRSSRRSSAASTLAESPPPPRRQPPRGDEGTTLSSSPPGA